MKCTARAAIWRHRIIGPFLFENGDEEAVIVTKERHICVLNKFWRALRTRHGVNRDVQWYKQDGATPHIANITMDWLDHRFHNRLIRRCHESEWSLHLSDLNPSYFYLFIFFISILFIYLFLSQGVFERQCVWGQATIYCWTQSGHQSVDLCHVEKK